jgi:hypothetical protein
MDDRLIEAGLSGRDYIFEGLKNDRPVALNADNRSFYGQR